MLPTREESKFESVVDDEFETEVASLQHYHCREFVRVDSQS